MVRLLVVRAMAVKVGFEASDVVVADPSQSTRHRGKTIGPRVISTKSHDSDRTELPPAWLTHGCARFHAACSFFGLGLHDRVRGSPSEGPIEERGAVVIVGRSSASCLPRGRQGGMASRAPTGPTVTILPG